MVQALWVSGLGLFLAREIVEDLAAALAEFEAVAAALEDQLTPQGSQSTV